MTTKGKGGEGDYVLEYTPGPGFNIRHAAHEFAESMEETGFSLLLHLPRMTLEFEAGCTPQEIIDGYFSALHRRNSGRASNSNQMSEPLAT